MPYYTLETAIGNYLRVRGEYQLETWCELDF